MPEDRSVKKKKFWKCHMYGSSSLQNVVKKFFIVAYLILIESYGTFHKPKIKKNKSQL